MAGAQAFSPALQHRKGRPLQPLVVVLFRAFLIRLGLQIDDDSVGLASGDGAVARDDILGQCDADESAFFTRLHAGLNRPSGDNRSRGFAGDGNSHRTFQSLGAVARAGPFRQVA